MSVLAPQRTALTCACGAALEEHEEGVCAHCRMLERGDDRLVCHDSRGWLSETEADERVLCGCGCGMLEVPESELESEPIAFSEATVAFRGAAVNPWGPPEIIAAIKAWHARYGSQPRADVWTRGTEEHPSYSRVRDVFGTWNDAIAAAGFTPKTGGRANL